MSENKITIDELRNAVDEHFELTTEAYWHSLALHIKKCLSFQDMLMFVRDVVSSCFEQDTNEYLPEIKDFALRCCVLEYYAGIVLPEAISEKYEIVYHSDIASFIVRRVDETQFAAIIQAIDDKIEHLAQSNIEALNKQMNEVVTEFASLEENLAGIFDGIDNDTVSKIANAIAGGSFDEHKLVEAFQTDKKVDIGDAADGKIVPLPYKKA